MVAEFRKLNRKIKKYIYREKKAILGQYIKNKSNSHQSRREGTD